MGRKVLNMIGRRFGRWTVVSESAERGKGGSVRYLCKCDCGNEKVVSGDALRKGDSQSCGCYNLDVVRKFGKTKYKDKLYSIRRSMLDRCHNKNNKSYANYGARGITVCEEWRNSYETFKEWAFANGYKEGLWIERIDNDKGYSPDNCYWATPKEQQRNKRTNRIVNYNGKEMCVTDAAEASGINTFTITRRIELGWSEEDLFKPVDKKYSHSESIREGIKKSKTSWG